MRDADTADVAPFANAATEPSSGRRSPFRLVTVALVTATLLVVLLVGSAGVVAGQHQGGDSQSAKLTRGVAVRPASGGMVNVTPGTVISTSGTYVLNQSYDTGSGTFVTIEASDVVLDGRGHTINSTASGSYAVDVYNSNQQLTNVTVKNVQAWNWTAGIRYKNARGSTIRNNSVESSGPGTFGIRLLSSSNVTVGDNTVDGPAYGVHLASSNDNTIENNTATYTLDAGFGTVQSDGNTVRNNTAANNTQVGFNVVTSSVNNVLRNNTARDNGEGYVLLSSSDGNQLRNNTAIANANSGFEIDRSASNTLRNNTATANRRGFYLTGASQNVLADNNASGNGNAGYELFSNSDDNAVTGGSAVDNGKWSYRTYLSSSGNSVTDVSLGTADVSFTGENVMVKPVTSPPPDPAGVRNISQHLNVSDDSAGSTWIALNVSYSDGDVSGVNESSLRLWQYGGSSWSELSGTSVDEMSNEVGGNFSTAGIVAPMAQPPSSSIAASASANASDVAVGATVEFDGSGSSGATSYVWRVTRNGNLAATSSSATFAQAFPTAGVYNATLTVSDGGDQDADSVTVVVGDSGPPTAALDAYPTTAVVGESVQFFAGNSKDDLAGGIQKYEWDFDDDGTFDQTTTPSSSFGGVLVSHSYGSTGTRTVEVRVTDHTGKTDNATVDVVVRPSPTVTSSSVTWTGNGTQPTGNIQAKTTTGGGMFLFYLHPPGSPNSRDVTSTGADTTTELWVNFTITNYDPDAVMGGADLAEWNASPNANGAGTNLSLRLEPIEMQRNTSFTGTDPAQWEANYDRADVAIDAGVYLGAFDVPGGNVEANMTGAALTSDAQAFVPPQYDEQSGTLNYSVAAPGWKKDLDSKGNRVQNEGFYEATIPAGLVDWMGIQDADALAGVYRSNGSSSALTGMQVLNRSDGSLYVNVSGIHYSSATVSLKRDETSPLAALADASARPGQSVTLDASGSSDNRKIATYEWDVDDDGTYETSTTSSTTSRSFGSTGDYTVGVRVTDGAGNVDTDTATVSISSAGGGVSGGGGGFSPGTTTVERTSRPPAATTTQPPTPTSSATTTESVPVDSPTETATATATAAAGTTSSPGQPGLGAAVTLVALLATVAAARRR